MDLNMTWQSCFGVNMRVCSDDPCLWFMRWWMLSKRAKCFSCESHPEIGSRAGRRKERQVFSVHVDHQSKVYFSYCPWALIRVLAWQLCTKISTSRFNVKCFHWKVHLCFCANSHDIVNISDLICRLILFSGIICCRLNFFSVHSHFNGLQCNTWRFFIVLNYIAYVTAALEY